MKKSNSIGDFMDNFSFKYSATYSPEDNKLRLRAFNEDERMSEELYTDARAIGFVWAPEQKLFVKPRWTPAAEDFCLFQRKQHFMIGPK